MPWWLWVVLGIAAFAGESASMALFLLYVGVAALVAAGLALAGAAALVQFGVFLVLSVLLVGLVRPRMVQRLVGRVPSGALTNHGSMVDRVATVTEAVTPDGGFVRIGNGEYWSAKTNPPTTSIAVGTRVRVAFVDGLTAYVDPIVEGGTGGLHGHGHGALAGAGAGQGVDADPVGSPRERDRPA